MRDEQNPGGERQDSNGVPASAGAGVFAERHYTVAEIAEMWNLSRDTVRRLFCNEPGVPKLDNRARRTKRRYRTLRIPQSVLERVHRRLSLG